MIDGCAALILAGGDSRRMGCDKTSLEFAGKTLLQRAVEVMQARFSQVVVSVRQRRPDVDVPQVCDEIPDAGPLAGLCAGLEWAQARQVPWVFAMAADMPFLNPVLIDRLAEHRGDCQAVVPVVQGHPQPLAAFYSAAALPAFREILAAPGKHSLRAVLERLDVCRVNEVDLQIADPGLRSFFDLDTPEDVALALRAFSQER